MSLVYVMQSIREGAVEELLEVADDRGRFGRTFDGRLGLNELFRLE